MRSPRQILERPPVRATTPRQAAPAVPERPKPQDAPALEDRTQLRPVSTLRPGHGTYSAIMRSHDRVRSRHT